LSTESCSGLDFTVCLKASIACIGSRRTIQHWKASFPKRLYRVVTIILEVSHQHMHSLDCQESQ